MLQAIALEPEQSRWRYQVATLLNQIAAAMAPAVPAATPRLFVTSLARSVVHQQRLRALGYAAILDRLGMLDKALCRRPIAPAVSTVLVSSTKGLDA